MRKNIRMLISALAITIVFVSAAGITFSSLEVGWLTGNENEQVQILLQEDAKHIYVGDRKITPGKPIETKPYLVNTGNEDCYVRVKVNIPEYAGAKLFQLGNMHTSGFEEARFTAAQATDAAYWEQVDGYLYYRNKASGDKLRPGELTPPLYSAIMLNSEMQDEGYSAMQGSSEIVICAEAAKTDRQDAVEAFSQQEKA